MEARSDVEQVRDRPGMYVGNSGETGVCNLVLELVGNAVDLHLGGRCTSIDVAVEGDGTIEVRDDGPGLPVDGGDGLPPLETLLTRWSRAATVDGHRPHVHLGLGTGLFVVNALSESLELTTVRAGTETRIGCRRGASAAPRTSRSTTQASGTTVRFRPDATILGTARAPRTALTRRLEDLTFLAPHLTLRWRFAGAAEAKGLAGMIAAQVGCEVDAVARDHATVELSSGPCDIEVAMAWSLGGVRCRDPAVVDSFVNLLRTPGHGSHVDGLIDGVRAFRRKSAGVTDGLIAAVAVVFADVTYGNPSKDQLDTPEMRRPVARTALRALKAWAQRGHR